MKTVCALRTGALRRCNGKVMMMDLLLSLMMRSQPCANTLTRLSYFYFHIYVLFLRYSIVCFIAFYPFRIPVSFLFCSFTTCRRHFLSLSLSRGGENRSASLKKVSLKITKISAFFSLLLFYIRVGSVVLSLFSRGCFSVRRVSP